MKYTSQPDGISCGPTCLKMIHDHLKGGDIDIEDLKLICGTDDIKGTTLEDMITGLNAIGIPYEAPSLETDGKAMAYLIKAINKGNPVILRTLTKGAKHWIIVTGIKGSAYHPQFEVKDPWLGEITYNTKQILAIWRPRNYHCLQILVDKLPSKVVSEFLKEVGQEIKIRKVKARDQSQIFELMRGAFGHVMSPEAIRPYTKGVTNWQKSIVVTRGSEVLGFYLLGDDQLNSVLGTRDIKIYFDPKEYANKKGVEGVALVVKPSARELGLGSKLKDFTRTLGYDYIWGMQFKKLHNLDHWLKRRKLAAETKNMNVTVEDFK